MATVLVWYHDGAKLDTNGRETPVLKEPSLNANDQAESVNTPGACPAAPPATQFVHVRTDAAVNYTVRPPGEVRTATGLNKRMEVGVMQIALTEGQTIHFADA